MYDLIGIVCAPTGGEDYLKDVRKFWSDLANDAVQEFSKPRVTYENGTPRLPWRQATDVMLQQMEVFKRVNHGR